MRRILLSPNPARPARGVIVRVAAAAALLVLVLALAACGSSDNSKSTSSASGSGGGGGGAKGVKLAGPPEFRTRFAGLRGLKQVYGLSGFAFTPLTIGLQYKALDQGKVDVADVFTTDGALQSGKYTILKDPKGVFGFQNVAMVINQKVAQKQGQPLISAINSISAKLTTQAVRQMNAAVDVNKLDPKDVAQKFLKANGLLTPGTQGKGKPPLTLGAKNFTEQFLLGELYKQGLQAKGFSIDLKSNLGSTEIANKALQSAKIDMYPEYAGVIVAELLGAKKLPSTPQQTYTQASGYEQKHGFVMTKPTPFNNTDALAATKAFASKNGLTSIPDLGNLLK